MAREGGGRFEFGWLGILGMFTVFTAGSVVIFFLGIYVGKGLQESRLAREERVVRLPVSRGEGGVEPARDAVPGPSADAAAALPVAAASVNLAVRSAVEPPAPLPTSVAAAPAPIATPVTPRVAQPTATRVVAAPTAVVAKAEPPRATAAPAAGGKGWSVQVNATKDQATADRLVARLSELGYQSFIVKVRLADETWYRVRVGRFPTMQAATAVVMRLKNEERYSRAFLVNE
ncbi:MAG: SPOR domain-containing protein [Deltaproteobacteria bacterium]|nr:SPOR domain-containing protein [Deltaproteobacteria bacterium]